MKFEETARRSGRTTRMMEEAKRLDADGKAVYVVFSTRAECDYWKDFVAGTRINLKTPESIGGDEVMRKVLLKENFRNQDPNTEVLVDIRCILERYGPYGPNSPILGKEES